MPLVDYPSSESEEDETSKSTHPLKRKRPSLNQESSSLPPLPASFHDLYSTNTRTSTSDDPALHGGRKRQIPHVQGNWPSHVYLDWHPTPSETSILNFLITKAGALNASSGVHSLLLSDLSAPLPLHISLSRSLVLKTEQRDEFLERTTANLKQASVRPFNVEYSKLAWYPNHDQTRWFLSLSIARPDHDELNQLLDACNAAASSMHQPKLYVPNDEDVVSKSRSKKRKKSDLCIESDMDVSTIPDCSDFFHISLAWSLSPQQLNEEVFSSDATKDALKGLSTTFDVVKVKIGNVISPIALSSRTSEARRGILGV